MAKYSRSIRKQFQLQKKAENFRREQTEYYKFFLEYQRRSGSR